MSDIQDDALDGSVSVIKHTLRVARSHPEILVYPYSALFFISITYPLLSATIFARWYNRIFADVGVYAPHKVAAIIGLVSFSAFYAALVTAYFTTAVSASVLAKLEGLSVPPFYGLLRVIKNFFRVTRFAILSVFFFPVGIFVQRKKLPDGLAGVLGSSLTLHMAQVSPAILTTRNDFGDTVRVAINTLGRAWREGLVLKVGMYISIFLIIILPKLVQHHWFKSHAASDVGWLVSLELGASSYVTFKVINSIFTTVLYHEARKRKNT